MLFSYIIDNMIKTNTHKTRGNQMEAILKQIQENIEELKIRAEANQTILSDLKRFNMSNGSILTTEKELSRIAGMIDTYTSCYQMIDNQMSLNNTGL